MSLDGRHCLVWQLIEGYAYEEGDKARGGSQHLLVRLYRVSRLR